MNILRRVTLKNSVLIISIVLLFSAGSTIRAQQTVLGKVKGYVLDQQGNVIPSVEVTIENSNFRKIVLPDSDSFEYQLELPADIYSATTKLGTWYSAKRAVFQVKANETTVINLSPAIRVAAIFLQVTATEVQEPVEYAKEPKYEEFLPFTNSPLNIVIEYQNKKLLGSVAEYRNAKLTYNNQSVFADVLRFNKKTLFIEAKGNVRVDENGRRQNKQSASLQITKIEAEQQARFLYKN